MAERDLNRLHVTIDGRVQGVGFRYFVYDHARASGIKGWVRNRFDGSVEALLEGTRPELDRLLCTLRRGPRSAMVTTIDPTWSEATGEYLDFKILPTA